MAQRPPHPKLHLNAAPVALKRHFAANEGVAPVKTKIRTGDYAPKIIKSALILAQGCDAQSGCNSIGL